jgi:lipopolysaccharide export system permease protein
MKTFDRYLFGRFLYAYVILFISTYGLYVVIDGFTNVDGFQDGRDGIGEVLRYMGVYYLYQSSLFFDLVSSILSVMAIMIVFALMQRHSELHPLLAAGVPMYRLAMPVVAGVMVLNAVIVFNQEMVMPQISDRLQDSRSQKDEGYKQVEPDYDYATQIYISGKGLLLSERQMHDSRFRLPVPKLVTEITTLEAPEAVFYAATKKTPAGWRLTNPTPKFSELRLTSEGTKIIRRVENSEDIFVVTDVSFDQLYNRSRNYRYVSTRELIRRVNNPALGSVRGQAIYLHARILQPLLNIIAVFLTVPLVVRKESRSLIGNMAACAAVMCGIYGFAQFLSYAAQVNIVSAELSAWLPAIVSGALCAWLSPLTQT